MQAKLLTRLWSPCQDRLISFQGRLVLFRRSQAQLRKWRISFCVDAEKKSPALPERFILSRRTCFHFKTRTVAAANYTNTINMCLLPITRQSKHYVRTLTRR